MYHKTCFWVYSWMFTLVLVLWLVKKDLPLFLEKDLPTGGMHFV